MLEKIKFEKFTAFEKLEVKFSPGINIFVGENGTGKTHILKAAYAACDIAKSKGGFAEKINNVFYPSGKQIGRLVKRSSVSSNGILEVTRKIEDDKKITLRLSLSNHTTKPDKAKISGSPKAWTENPMEAAYIPVKDMMANAPGFRSLYEEREIHFEEIYVDIIRKVFLPLLKGPTDKPRKQLLESLQEAMDGKVVAKNEEFFLRSKHGELEFTLLAEGFRKMGLLWILIQNGTLLNGSVLFWDEPETNLNPRLMKTVVGILLELQRQGVQIFLTTHDYVILKEFDLQAKKDDKILFHSLYRTKDTGEIEVASTDDYLKLSPNAIDDTFGSIVDREIEKSMGSLGK
ncbi:MAG: AAA family ATPase [Proteobacteria bacterium]|jgi:predicted ATP-dependent endonuclease of OLD family|nr:AAA family ATPase [Desulfocapsa sp.]MBU3944915.1 AAA family ATPase [Pseudomonadota bacterium]MCG2743142.1 AAA family ATPase [Desulfobacteraceae bacterium]MBU3984630.1 AAA family ATPase [Pseudomonadota bacterium]MBU4027561.1 AAA family ATPase [Pseudomonadota bacterium]